MGDSEQNLKRELEALQAEVNWLRKSLSRAAPHLNAQVQLLKDITAQIRQSSSVAAVLSTVVGQVRQQLQTDRALVLRLDQNSQGTVMMESVDAAWPSIQAMSYPASMLGSFDLKRQAQAHRSVISSVDASDLSSEELELLNAWQAKAILSVPIWCGAQVWGWLTVHQCTAPRHWQPDEVDLLDQIALQLSSLLVQADKDSMAPVERAVPVQITGTAEEGEAKYRLLCDCLPIGILQTDAAGQCFYTNAQWQALSGLTEEQSLGYGWTTVVHPEDRTAVRAEWRDCVSRGAEFSQEFRCLNPQGQVYWMSVRAAALQSATGQVIGYVGTTEDISKAKIAEVVRKQAERELREVSEALSNAVEGISRLDDQGRYLNVNDAYARMVGYTPAEMVGMHWPKTVLPEDLPVVQAAYQRMIGDGKVEVEVRGIRQDGSVFYKQLFMVAIYDAQQRLTGHHCFMKDISDRKQAEVALQQLNRDLDLNVQTRTAQLHQTNVYLQQELLHRQQAEEALRHQVAREKLLATITQKIRQSLDLNSILSTAVQEVRELLQADRALIFQLTPEQAGVVVEESVLPPYPTTVTALHFPKETFPEACYHYYTAGQPRIVLDIATDRWADCLRDMTHALDVKSKIVAPIMQHRTEEEPILWGLLIVHACSYRRQWQQDEADLLQQIANQIAISLQQAALYQRLQQELNERKQAQISLQQSESLFRSLCESAPIGIFRNDVEGNCVYTNPRCQEIAGFTYEEALGNGWQQFIHPDDLEKIKPLRTADGADKRPSFVEIRHVHKDGTVRLCQVKAVPILSVHETLLGYVGTVEDITDTRAIEQMKNEFIAIVSHELRTPLASIRGSLGLLASGVLKDDPATGQHMLNIAATETERLVRLVGDILDLERLESSKVALDRQACDAGALMQQAVAVLQPLAEARSITLVCSPLHVSIWAAPDRIIQTLVNLLGNAIKFSPAHSTVTLTALAQGTRVLFLIQDQGPGIPANHLEKIFKRFQQVDASDARNKSGTGLGLAICRNIVQQHGGHIWAESVLGQGSTFLFTIPMALSEQ
ncbi:MAG TPA: PAS domain S-box protein [Stenomitos sp.]